MKNFQHFSIGILSVITLATGGATLGAQTSYKFNFSGDTKAGWIQVSPTNVYSTDGGHGFEPGAAIGGGDLATSDKPFYFSA